MTDRATLWEQVKTFYKDKFGSSPELVDIAADYDILKMYAAGSGILSIANFLDLSNQLVTDVITRNFGFYGMDEDLNLNPLKIYKELDTKDLESFKNIIVTNYGYYPDKILDNMWTAASLVSSLERLLNDHWI